MFNDNVDNFHGVKAFKAKVCFCNPTQLVHKNMTDQLYVCPREMFHNCLENCCRHVQAFPSIGRQPFDCRGYLEQPTAIFGAGGEKMWKFLEQAARKGGNLLREILNFN